MKCKENFYYYNNLLFEKDAEYDISYPETYNGRKNWDYLYFDIYHDENVWIPKDYITKHFYSLDEMREIKLEKMNL